MSTISDNQLNNWSGDFNVETDKFLLKYCAISFVDRLPIHACRFIPVLCTVSSGIISTDCSSESGRIISSSGASAPPSSSSMIVSIGIACSVDCNSLPDTLTVSFDNTSGIGVFFMLSSLHSLIVFSTGLSSSSFLGQYKFNSFTYLSHETVFPEMEIVLLVQEIVNSP